MKKIQENTGFLFGLHKPLGPTSHDCVNLTRRLLQTKKVGHAGTLDPQAEGVLIMGVGSATKLLTYIKDLDKVYTATISFGAQTDTDDAEGVIVCTKPVSERVKDPGYARSLLASFVGVIKQIPPAYSAVSKNGIRAYKAARSGQPLKLEARNVTISQAELIDIIQGENISWQVRFTVSSGCYIRSLAKDLGEAVGSVAYLKSLTREQVGSIGLEQCVQKETLNLAFEKCLNPLELCDLLAYELSDAELKEVLFGRPFEITSSIKGLLGVMHNEKLYGIWKRVGTKLTCVQNFSTPIVGSLICQT